jgi:hypothetical protein
LKTSNFDIQPQIPWATRRLGELMEAQRKTVGLAKGAAEKRGGSNPPRITLAEVGIDKDLAKQARKFAAMTEEKFEGLVERRAEAAVAAMAGDKAFIRAIRVEQQTEKKEARAHGVTPAGTTISPLCTMASMSLGRLQAPMARPPAAARTVAAPAAAGALAPWHRDAWQIVRRWPR